MFDLDFAVFFILNLVEDKAGDLRDLFFEPFLAEDLFWLKDDSRDAGCIFFADRDGFKPDLTTSGEFPKDSSDASSVQEFTNGRVCLIRNLGA